MDSFRKISRRRQNILGLVVLGFAVSLLSIRPSYAQTPAHLGTDFWLAFPDAFSDGAELYIQSEQTTSFTVSIVNPAFSFTGTVSPGDPQTVLLPTLAEIRSNQTVETKGIHLTSDQPISVIFRSPVPVSNEDDAYLGLPTPALGTEYIVMGYEETLGSRTIFFTLGPSEFALVATENGTTATITTTCRSFSGTPAGSTLTVNLNQSQTYQYKCLSGGDVTGTSILSNKPIAVFGGNRCADVPRRTAFCDYLVEQVIPLSMWGKDYWTFPLDNGTADILRILAAQDGTLITIDDGVSPQTVTLDRGNFFDVTTDRATHITGTDPILVAQFGRGGRALPTNDNRDPLMMLIVPTELFFTNYRVFTPPGYPLDFINIIAPSEAVSTVEIDGVPVDGFAPLPGGAFHGVTVPVGDGEHTVTASLPISIYMYGFGFFTSYGYPGGFAAGQPGVKIIRNIRVIDTISTVNIDLDATSFSTAPTSINVGTDRTTIEWQFSTFTTGQIENLSFDVILKNPVPGEDRLVNHKLEVLYTDINGSPVRTELGPQFVHVLTSAFSTDVTTDKTQYGANEDVLIDLAITNLSDFARTVDAVVEIEDSQGNLVQSVTTLSALSFAAGETKTFLDLLYNTGTTFGGNYRARARLIEAGKQVDESLADFTILAVQQATSAIVADKITYSSNEPVTLTSTVTSQSLNSSLTDLEATVNVTDPSGISIFSETRAVRDLLPEERFQFNSFTNTGIHPAGLYNVTLQVQSNGEPLTSAANSFEIISSLLQAEALSGVIEVNPGSIFETESTTLTFTIQNTGNDIDLPLIEIEILMVDPDTTLPVRTITAETSLNGREVYVDSILFDSTGLAPKSYLVVLRGITAGVTQTLDSTGLEIKPVSNNAPRADAGPDQLGFVDFLVTLDGTGSTDPDGDPLSFRWNFISVPATSQITDDSLADATTPASSFTPDAEGIYVLSLVVNDGFLDSPVDTVSVFVNPPPTVDIHPETINLKSNGGSKSITGVLSSPVLSSFEFFTASDGVTVTASFTLENSYIDKDGATVVFTIAAEVHPGSDTVEEVDADGDGNIDLYRLTLKFNRDDLIAGFTDMNGQLRITQATEVTSTVIGDGLIAGSDINTVIAPPGVSK